MRLKPKISIFHVDLHACNSSEGAKAIIEVEGRLLIFIDHKLWFDEVILLLELAILLHDWLEKIDRDTLASWNFFYESMNYEDKPILEFTDQQGEWLIYSVWQKFLCRRKIDAIELIKATKDYISNLQQELKTHHDFELKNWFKS